MEELQDRIIKELMERIDKQEKALTIYKTLVSKQDQLIESYKRDLGLSK
jgi:hypothetical protein